MDQFCGAVAVQILFAAGTVFDSATQGVFVDAADDGSYGIGLQVESNEKEGAGLLSEEGATGFEEEDE